MTSSGPGTEPVDHQTWWDGQISLPTFHDTKVKLRFISDLLHLSVGLFLKIKGAFARTFDATCRKNTIIL